MNGEGADAPCEGEITGDNDEAAKKSPDDNEEKSSW